MAERILLRWEGPGFGHQKVQGAFTLTARVADIDLTTQENRVHRANWLGLYAQNDIQRPFHGSRFGIYCTAGLGNRGAADYPDLAGTYMSKQTFPHDRWLRISRNEQQFRAYSSPDGVKQGFDEQQRRACAARVRLAEARQGTSEETRQEI